jgi:hypothetical protein
MEQQTITVLYADKQGMLETLGEDRWVTILPANETSSLKDFFWVFEGGRLGSILITGWVEGKGIEVTMARALKERFEHELQWRVVMNQLCPRL